MSPTSGGNPFRISTPPHVLDRVRDLRVQAYQEGRGAAFDDALRTIVHRLQTDPRDFGEVSYRLEAAELEVRLAIISPLVVDFGVHDAQMVVFIRRFVLLSHAAE